MSERIGPDALEQEVAKLRAQMDDVRMRVDVLKTMCLGPPGLVNFIREWADKLAEKPE